MNIKTLEFINKVKAKKNPKHTDSNGNWLYTYSNSDYVNSNVKILITCSNHGDFLQAPKSHLSGSGCPKCYGTTKHTTESFIARANTIHNDLYGYKEVDYITTKIKVKINCLVHGIFKQTPNDHLSGKGCPSCASGSLRSTDSFIFNAKLIHGELYGYDKTIYDSAHGKVVIDCAIHGEFLQTATNHLSGYGCSKCGLLAIGFTKTIFKAQCLKHNKGLGILYVLRCYNDKENFYKIGITSGSINKRYRNNFEMPYDYEVIHEVHREPDKIYNMEHKLLKVLGLYKYEPLINFGGHTECFTTLDPAYRLFKNKLAA